MKLVTIDAYPNGRTGVLLGDDILDFGLAAAFVPLAAWVPASMPVLLAGGGAGLDVIRRVVEDVRGRAADEQHAMRAARALQAYDDRLLAAPVLPRVLLAHGRAYRSHSAGMRPGEPAPEVDEPPSVFTKSVNSIIGPGAPIVLPAQCPDMVDLEVEFSVVFGADCYNVEEAAA